MCGGTCEGYTCIYVHIHVKALLSGVSSTIIYLTCLPLQEVSPLEPGITLLASLADQLSLGIPCLCLPPLQELQTSPAGLVFM